MKTRASHEVQPAKLPRPRPPEGSALQGRGAGMPRFLDTAAPLALTRDGRTELTPAVDVHPERRRILAHEAVHRDQFGAPAPRGSRTQLEADARAGAAARLAGRVHVPRFSAPRGMSLAYDTSAWFPDMEARNEAETRSLEREGLTDDSRAEYRLDENQSEDGGEHSARYEISVSASGRSGTIDSYTRVTLSYDDDRRVGVVGPAVRQLDPETGLGPVSDRPAYPYTLTYLRTIHYTDADGREATVEVSGHVFASEQTIADQIGVDTEPSFERLLGLRGDSGYVDATISGSGPVTGYFAGYAARGLSLDIQTRGLVGGLGLTGGYSLMSVSSPASFVDPRETAGEQYASLRAFLVGADAAELARRRAIEEAREARSWWDDLSSSLAEALGGLFTPLIQGLDDLAEAISDAWNALPAWGRGILTALGKFVAALGAIAAVAGLVVLAAKGAIAFGTAMLIVGAAALVIGFGVSLGSRLVEAWRSDNRWRVLAAPLVALLDVVGISGIVQGWTNESILTGAPLGLSEEERWETGTSGALQLVGIFFMARGLRARGSGRPAGETVTPEVRGPMADFHALPESRLPVLPEGHYWVRRGPEWVLYREPGAPDLPIEISIYSDGAGQINYNVRTGDLVLQSEARTRPSGDTFPRGREDRLPPELRGTGDDNPFLDQDGVLYEKGHGVDYADRIEGPGVRSSNHDVANFAPQARFWNSFLRNHLVRAIRGRGGGYREMPVYDSAPPRTVDGTPIPREFVFVETNGAGEPVAAWRIPNTPAGTTRRVADIPPAWRLTLDQIPEVMLRPDGTLQPPGAVVTGTWITGARAAGEEPGDTP